MILPLHTYVIPSCLVQGNITAVLTICLLYFIYICSMNTIIKTKNVPSVLPIHVHQTVFQFDLVAHFILIG